jgi:hypothetical protein
MSRRKVFDMGKNLSHQMDAVQYAISPGRAMGKTEHIRKMLADYKPGQVVHMTATEAKQQLEQNLINSQKVGEAMEKAIRDDIAKAMASAFQEALAKETGAQWAQMGTQPWREFPMGDILSPEEQEVMATFGICPQCNRDGQEVLHHDDHQRHFGRGWVCYNCAQTLNIKYQEAMKREMMKAQEKHMENMLARQAMAMPKHRIYVEGSWKEFAK